MRDDRDARRVVILAPQPAQGGGALVVSFSLAGVPPAAAARGDVAGPPDPKAVDSWIAIHADNTATIYFGKIEMGQGNTTGMLQIAGEELGLDISQMTPVRGDTNVTPDQGATSSSSSIQYGGPELRAAAAEARHAMLLLAAKKLSAQVGSLVVSRGVVSVDGEPGRSVTYGDLIGDKLLKAKSRARRRSSRRASTPSLAPAFRGSICRTRWPANTSTCSTCDFQT